SFAGAAAARAAGVARTAKLVVEDDEDRMVFGSLRFSFPEVSEALARVRVEYETPLGKVENELEMRGPILWTPERPFLYKYKICGKDYFYAIRRYAFDGGFSLNGRPRRLRVAAWDPAFGLAAAEFPAESASRWLRALKEMGADAVRLPGSLRGRGVLELCDRQGLVVCDGRFDCGAAEVAGRGESAALDFCALPNDAFSRWRSAWDASEPTVRVFPHWNRDAKEGDKVVVGCYTSGDEAELFVNGESCGRRKKGDGGAVSWEVPYDSGEVKAIAYREGHVIGEDVRKTAYKAVAVRLEPDCEALADGETGFVRIWLEDEYGTALPTAVDTVSLVLDGPGEFVAAGNGAGDIGEAAGAKASCSLSAGRAVAAVRRGHGSGVALKLTASAKGLRSAEAVLPRFTR
ncbi:MAG: DUF4982 domain-containing protein, partial [Kiritimatiellae bacterium]|nr:DUF4982 domain-containing protein [Kiritimatiellia bacterium]